MSVSYDDLRVWKNIHHDLKDELLHRTIGLLECSICSEVMHVPFLAVCGHSFCYGCLDAWFETKVNCPTCRQDMNEPPVLNIQLREVSKIMTDLVIDTLEDDKHKKDMRDAREQIISEYDAAVKAKKLFKDAFDSAPTLVDRSDGVPRCGNCHWEAHGSSCLHCGARFRTPRGDSYYDSEDGDAYNEDQEEIEVYGVDTANYDSEDSFIDNRGPHEIHNDQYDSDGLLSSGDDEASVMERFSGFRDDGEMYRGSEDETGYFEDAAPASLDSDSEMGSDVGSRRNSHRSRYNVESEVAEVASDLDSETNYENAQYISDSENEGYNQAMQHAVEQLHDRDAEDYSRNYNPDFDNGSDSDWGTSVAMGRRSAHIIDSDSE